MRSSNGVINKFVAQCFGDRTPEWTRVAPKSSQDDPKMVLSLQKMTPSCPQITKLHKRSWIWGIHSRT